MATGATTVMLRPGLDLIGLVHGERPTGIVTATDLVLRHFAFPP
ncbi:hypothetical protein [Rhodococcus jostii]|nr:hypothetical protein [Rhodococcus jostii]